MKYTLLSYCFFFISGFLVAQDSKTLPIRNFPAKEKSDTLIIYFTSENGFEDFDESLVQYFLSRTYSVVGLDIHQFCHKEKTAQEIGEALSDIIDISTKDNEQATILLCGYKMGANLIPFGYKNLSNELKEKIHGLILIGVSRLTLFESRRGDVNLPLQTYGKSVQDELVHISPKKLFIICNDEDTAICRALRPGWLHYITLGNSNYFKPGDTFIFTIIDSIFLLKNRTK